jgi:hypothetical protein
MIYICLLTSDFTGHKWEEEETQDAPFAIKHKVPYNNGIWTLNLLSTTLFDEFLKALTVKMMVPAVASGYILLFFPKSPKLQLKLLEDEESYSMMIKEIEDYIMACCAKNQGKGAIKLYHIQIINTSDGDSKKTSSKVGFLLVFLWPSFKVPQVKRNDPQPVLPAETNDDQEHKLMQQIEKHHACSEHKGKVCFIHNDGSHYQYTFLDLSIWALLLVCQFSLHSLVTLDLDEVEMWGYNHPSFGETKSHRQTRKSVGDPEMFSCGATSEPACALPIYACSLAFASELSDYQFCWY